jgi:hypothetical protein
VGGGLGGGDCAAGRSCAVSSQEGKISRLKDEASGNQNQEAKSTNPKTQNQNPPTSECTPSASAKAAARSGCATF